MNLLSSTYKISQLQHLQFQQDSKKNIFTDQARLIQSLHCETSALLNDSNLSILRNTIPFSTLNNAFSSPLSPPTMVLKRTNSNQLKTENKVEKKNGLQMRAILPEILPQTSVSNHQKKRFNLTNLAQSRQRVENSHQLNSKFQSQFDTPNQSICSTSLNNLILKPNNVLSLQIGLTNEIQDSFKVEKDERFKYLMKYGSLKKIEMNGGVVFVELPQIQGTWVGYRRPLFRDKSIEKLELECIGLEHIPLLEGEERLKQLSYKQNYIYKIENLVSLPSLLILDLSHNSIKDIENLQNLNSLKVLSLAQNNITKMKFLDCLLQLEQLDLSHNKIIRIEGIIKLTFLKQLDLSYNNIPRLENIEGCAISLVDLNISHNFIEAFPLLPPLPILNKLQICSNKIPEVARLSPLKSLPSLKELSIEGNPFTKLPKITYLQHLLQLMPESILKLDNKELIQIRDEIQTVRNRLIAANKPTQISNQKQKTEDLLKDNQKEGGNELQGENQSDQEYEPEKIIKIIEQQWKEECKRVEALDLQGASRKDYLRNSKVEGGHAEIEEEWQSSLFVFGNAFEIVLQNNKFQDKIEKIQLQYILYDRFTERQVLSYLKNFKKLKELILIDNHVTSLLQLSKLEILSSLRYLSIENSELCKCSFLKEFIIYRFPCLIKFNSKEVRELDRLRSKGLFKHFDKVLQLPERYYDVLTMRSFPSASPVHEMVINKDKTCMKTFAKSISQVSETFISDCIGDQFQQQVLQQEETDNCFDEYILKLIESVCGLQL